MLKNSKIKRRHLKYTWLYSFTPDVESNSFTVICFQETGTPNGPFVLAICDKETTGLGMECEIIQLSCLVQGKAPFNQYLLPDKKMISDKISKWGEAIAQKW